LALDGKKSLGKVLVGVKTVGYKKVGENFGQVQKSRGKIWSGKIF